MAPDLVSKPLLYSCPSNRIGLLHGLFRDVPRSPSTVASPHSTAFPSTPTDTELMPLSIKDSCQPQTHHLPPATSTLHDVAPAANLRPVLRLTDAVFGPDPAAFVANRTYIDGSGFGTRFVDDVTPWASCTERNPGQNCPTASLSFSSTPTCPQNTYRQDGSVAGSVGFQHGHANPVAMGNLSNSSFASSGATYCSRMTCHQDGPTADPVGPPSFYGHKECCFQTPGSDSGSVSQTLE